MGKKSIIVIMLFILAISLAIYTYLGGFKEVELRHVAIYDIQIMGKSYKGKTESDILRKMFLEFKEMSLEENRGPLVMLYYQDVDGETDQIDCFVGLLINDEKMTNSEDLEIRSFKTQGVIRARFDGHRLVTPNPGRVQSAAREFATANHHDMQNIFVEKYFSNNAIEVDFLLN